MPATSLPVARVTKEKNKLVIVQHNKKHWYLLMLFLLLFNILLMFTLFKLIQNILTPDNFYYTRINDLALLSHCLGAEHCKSQNLEINFIDQNFLLK